MIIGEDNSEKFFGLNPVEMMTLDGPACDERFYLDSWKPVPAVSPAPSSGGSSVASSDVTAADVDSSWRRTSNTSEAYDEGSVWGPTAMQTDCTGHGYNYPSPHYSDSGSTWKDRPVEQWSADDVTLWICSLMNSHSHYTQNVNVAAYLNLRGPDLLNMSSSDMQNRDPESGIFVFMSLQHHMSQVTSPNPYNNNSPNHSPYSPANRMASPPRRATPVKEEPKVTEKFPSIDLTLLPSLDLDTTFSGLLSLGNGTGTGQGADRANHTQPTPPAQTSPQLNNMAGGSFPPMFAPPIAMPPPPPSLVGPWPAYPFPTHHDLYPPGAGGNHLWEFIRDLLFDSRYNPSLIKWEDREEGIFKFVKSDQVAKLWGKKKNNSAMTYEKLSRAMRYYYRRKILERIDGRRLVYKFGPMATGWKA